MKKRSGSLNIFSRNKKLDSSTMHSARENEGKISKIITNSLRASSAMARQDWTMASSLWLNVIANAKADTPIDVYIKLSSCYRQSEKYLEADELLQEPLKKFGSSKILRYEYAEIASSRKDWPEAIKRWQAILDEFGDDSPENSYVRLSYALAKIGSFQLAKDIVLKGQAIHPTNLAIQVAGARVFMEHMDWPEAIKRWQAILKSGDSLEPPVLTLISKSYRNNSTFAEAEALIREALLKFGRSTPALLIEYAEIASSRKDWPEAIKRWQAILDEFGASDKLNRSDKLLCRFNLSVLHRLISIDDYKKEITQYQKKKIASTSKQDRIVVYTAMSKGYDTLKLPEKINPKFDYVCFTDDPETDGMGVFDILPLPNKTTDPGRAIRYAKTHPHTLFSDYRYAVWLDASIMLVDDIMPMIESFKKSGLPLASTPHPVRQTLEEEYMACVNLMKDDPEVMRRQVDVYKKKGIVAPSFAENGVLLFDTHSKKLGSALETWWEQIQKYSKRDQLSFGYAMEKWSMEWFPLTKKPNDMRDHPDLVITPHHQESNLLENLYSLLDKA